jgi:hypothetical protein
MSPELSINHFSSTFMSIISFFTHIFVRFSCNKSSSFFHFYIEGRLENLKIRSDSSSLFMSSCFRNLLFNYVVKVEDFFFNNFILWNFFFHFHFSGFSVFVIYFLFLSFECVKRM